MKSVRKFVGNNRLFSSKGILVLLARKRLPVEGGVLGLAAFNTILMRRVIEHRSALFVCFVTLLGMLVIGCSVSMRDQESSVNPSANEVVVQNSVLPSYQLPSPKEILPENRLPSDGGSFPVGIQSISPASSAELISSLERVGLWNNSFKGEVTPLLINAFPADLVSLDVESKKRVFLHSLLPVVMVALEEVRLEKESLQVVLRKFDCEPDEIFFTENDTSWQSNLSLEEILYVRMLSQKYRHINAAQLLKRIDVLPVSLVLAQGAIESSWGTSRFACLGNNLFGMWTWGEKGIVPMEREEGKKHKIAVYNSILDSVRAYILTINRLPAYDRLRELRMETSDPILLSYGLLNYSERRDEYVNDLQKIISYNRLDDLDRHSLASL